MPYAITKSYERNHRDTEIGSREDWEITGTNRISITRGTFFAGASLSGTYLLCVVLDFLLPSVGILKYF